MTERLQKYLARTGAGSRREIEDWIRAGRVSVDGQTATLGLKVDESSRIAIDGTNIPEYSQASEQSRAIMDEGCARAEVVAAETLREVRQVVGTVYN